MEDRLNAAFSKAADAKTVPGIAAIALDRSGKTLFKGAWGSTNLGNHAAPKMTSSTPLLIWSCTKLVTSVAALQLVEQGKLSLDDPVEKYVPRIANLQLLEGVVDGKPVLHDVKKKPTVLHLITHTAGFTYDLFDQPTQDWRVAVGQTPGGYVAVGALKDFDTPLEFEPGSRWNYGINIDWLGFVVQAVSGLPLEEYIDKHILKPLGMNDSGPHVDKEKMLVIHHRAEDRSLTANPDLAAAAAPETYGGGHYLHSTLDDYAKFLLALVNYGTNPISNVKILEEKTAREYLFKDQLPKICSDEGVGFMKSVVPALSLEGEFLPGVKKGWSCGLLLNLEAAPKGRSAGSGAWAGLGNLYYWLDPVEGKTGLVISEILPFLDKEVLHLFDELERAVYGHEAAKEMGEAGSNHTIFV